MNLSCRFYCCILEEDLYPIPTCFETRHARIFAHLWWTYGKDDIRLFLLQTCTTWRGSRWTTRRTSEPGTSMETWRPRGWAEQSALLSRVSGKTNTVFTSVSWFREILVQIRFRGSVPTDYGSGFGSGTCSFPQWPSRCEQKIDFFYYYFLKVHLHHSPKIKSHKEVTKQ